MIDFTSTVVVVATDRAVAADVGGEVVVLHLDSGHYFGLENVGARVWDLVKEPISVGEIERVLLEEYEIEPERCRREVTQLLSDLVDEGLLEARVPS